MEELKRNSYSDREFVQKELQKKIEELERTLKERKE